MAQIAALIANDTRDERSRTRDGFEASTPETRGSKRKAEEAARRADQAAKKDAREVEKIKKNLEAQEAKADKARRKTEEEARKKARDEAKAEAADTQRKLAKKAKEVAAKIEVEKQRKIREMEATSLEQPPGMGTEDIRIRRIADNIRKIHPKLADYSDEFLASQSVAELKKATRDLNTAEAAKPGKRLEMRHRQNFAKARANPTVIPEGLDNRSSILHGACFLPGAAAKGADIWLQAQKVWGPQGVEPICNYDMTIMGLAGCITAKHRELRVALYSKFSPG